METLLNIIELAEKRMVANICDENGVYHIHLPREGGYARSGMPFFEPDAMYEFVSSTGEPAFPPSEDLPRNKQVSFDVHYLVSPCNVVHRITISRAHNQDVSFIKACFVDGDLIYMSGGGREKLKVYLFNAHERASGAILGKLPHFWFHLETQRIDVIADAYFSIEKQVWKGISPKSPCHYGIFVNDRSTINRNSTLTQHRLQNTHYWVTLLSIFFLLPVWFVWKFLDSFFVVPVQQSMMHCEVRSYWLQEKDGWVTQNEVGVEAITETTRLLG
jgi:hypothetical protein